MIPTFNNIDVWLYVGVIALGLSIISLAAFIAHILIARG